MRRAIPLIALLICALGASAAYATKCNYHFTNVCYKNAYDIELVLWGDVSFSDFYNDISDGQPAVTKTTSTTSAHWTNRGPNGAQKLINRNQTVHVGFTPTGPFSCTEGLSAVYWTDENGKRIGPCVIGKVIDHWTDTSYDITNTAPFPLQVEKVRLACRANEWSLDSLYPQNEYLTSIMTVLADSATLAPGQTWEIPATRPCHQCYCVTNFEAKGPDSAAVFSPWVEEFVP